MDWTPVIGRRRPLEQDALRILTVVHQLGQPSPVAGIRSSLATESRLQSLDHLVREPVDLAYVVMDRLRDADGELGAERAALARRVRRLVTAPGRPRSATAPGHERRPFHPGAWERWDDVLAYLGCRGLLRVEALAASPGELGYLLTEAGAALLEKEIFPTDRTVARYRESCRLLREAVLDSAPPPETGSLAGSGLRIHLEAVAERLEAFRRENQIALGEDLLNRLFKTTFGEPL